jgi:hypothetical protein
MPVYLSSSAYSGWQNGITLLVVVMCVFTLGIYLDYRKGQK